MEGMAEVLGLLIAGRPYSVNHDADCDSERSRAVFRKLEPTFLTDLMASSRDKIVD